jgi:hypothetical protein
VADFAMLSGLDAGASAARPTAVVRDSEDERPDELCAEASMALLVPAGRPGELSRRVWSEQVGHVIHGLS